MERRKFRDYSSLSYAYPTWWQAASECFKCKVWGSVRVVLKKDNLYHIVGKEDL